MQQPFQNKKITSVRTSSLCTICNDPSIEFCNDRNIRLTFRVALNPKCISIRLAHRIYWEFQEKHSPWVKIKYFYVSSFICISFNSVIIQGLTKHSLERCCIILGHYSGIFHHDHTLVSNSFAIWGDLVVTINRGDVEVRSWFVYVREWLGW